MTFISGFSFLKYVAPKIEKEDTNNDINRETTAPTLPNEGNNIESSPNDSPQVSYNDAVTNYNKASININNSPTIEPEVETRSVTNENNTNPSASTKSPESYFTIGDNINLDDYQKDAIEQNFANNDRYTLEIIPDDNTIPQRPWYDIKIVDKESEQTLYIAYPDNEFEGIEIRKTDNITWTETLTKEVEESFINEFGEEELRFKTELNGKEVHIEHLYQKSVYDPSTGSLEMYEDNFDELIQDIIPLTALGNSEDNTLLEVIDSNWRELKDAIRNSVKQMDVRENSHGQTIASYNSYSDFINSFSGLDDSSNFGNNQQEEDKDYGSPIEYEPPKFVDITENNGEWGYQPPKDDDITPPYRPNDDNSTQNGDEQNNKGGSTNPEGNEFTQPPNWDDYGNPNNGEWGYQPPKNDDIKPPYRPSDDIDDNTSAGNNTTPNNTQTTPDINLPDGPDAPLPGQHNPDNTVVTETDIPGGNINNVKNLPQSPTVDEDTSGFGTPDSVIDEMLLKASSQVRNNAIKEAKEKYGEDAVVDARVSYTVDNEGNITYHVETFVTYPSQDSGAGNGNGVGDGTGQCEGTGNGAGQSSGTNGTGEGQGAGSADNGDGNGDDNKDGTGKGDGEGDGEGAGNGNGQGQSTENSTGAGANNGAGQGAGSGQSENSGKDSTGTTDKTGENSPINNGLELEDVGNEELEGHNWTDKEKASVERSLKMAYGPNYNYSIVYNFDGTYTFEIFGADGKKVTPEEALAAKEAAEKAQVQAGLDWMNKNFSDGNGNFDGQRFTNWVNSNFGEGSAYYYIGNSAQEAFDALLKASSTGDWSTFWQNVGNYSNSSSGSNSGGNSGGYGSYGNNGNYGDWYCGPDYSGYSHFGNDGSGGGGEGGAGGGGDFFNSDGSFNKDAYIDGMMKDFQNNALNSGNSGSHGTRTDDQDCPDA